MNFMQSWSKKLHLYSWVFGFHRCRCLKHDFLLPSPVKTTCASGRSKCFPGLFLICGSDNSVLCEGVTIFSPQNRLKGTGQHHEHSQHNEQYTKACKDKNLARLRSSVFLTEQHDADVTKPLPPDPVTFNCSVLTLGRVERSGPLH